uniref:PH domain-containing protein n=1 Tax=Pyramimonas obovata TaxID=1411642 RepID=A0A7S0R1W5_9CHLO|mmetsp:Transcript_23784/g.51942  ORF Transcript_23784/g.51942 Transcript_23784/m.51942 type:complete len:446 (+) Transcript_23784:104-1441(+)|eukprot:CAMPEP_0118927372 /NCGR_PEP_ID=MMETSP1169-20130426/4859_1 /TAXON_ID=36882 /ORGANISM="Pyramimonas obovata, Strain CCMP722" /LENGTH=445 /DNA_ID=CAMNT_0006869119 /DNA_START=38 /DNA_END=1375 /DNA_ORIENTATION=+
MSSSEASNGDRTSPLMAGQLWKRSDHLKLWKPRHFYFGSMRVADGTFAPVLIYKEKETDEKARGHISLDGSVGLLPSGEEHPTLTCFYIHGPKKRYVLGAESLADAQAWVAAILTTVRASITAGMRSPISRLSQADSSTSEGAYTEPDMWEAYQRARLTCELQTPDTSTAIVPQGETSFAAANEADECLKETQSQLAKARRHSVEVRRFTLKAMAGALFVAVDAPVAGLIAACTVAQHTFRKRNQLKSTAQQLQVKQSDQRDERDLLASNLISTGRALEAKVKEQEQRIAELMRESEVKDQMLVEAHEELEEVRAELANARQLAAAGDERVAQLESRVAAADERHLDSEAKIDMILQQCRDQGDKIEKLQETVQSETARRAAVEAELRSLEAQSESMKKQLDEADSLLLRPFEMWGTAPPKPGKGADQSSVSFSSVEKEPLSGAD